MRADGIGDAMVCVPLIAALKDAGHELGVLLTTVNANIFARGVFRDQHVVERIPWPRHGYTRETSLAAAGAMHGRYDVALIASEEPEAYRFARAAEIPLRVGFVNGWERPLKSWWVRRQLRRAVFRPASARRTAEHEVATIFRLGTGLHDHPRPSKDTVALRALVVDMPVARGERILCQLGAKWLANGRGIDDVANVLAELHARLPLSGIASASERALVEPVAERARIPVRYFAAAAPWKEAIAAARLLVTPDSGAAHVAGMVGTPCVDCFEQDGFDVQVRRWAPWAAPYRALCFTPRLAGFSRPLHAAALELLGE